MLTLMPTLVLSARLGGSPIADNVWVKWPVTILVLKGKPDLSAYVVEK